MVANTNSQSLSDFRKKATETLDRLNRTGQAEILTVDGQARAVLLAPSVYNELAREALVARDAATIQQSFQEIGEGKTQEAGEFFADLHAELLAMKDQQGKGGKD